MPRDDSTEHKVSRVLAKANQLTSMLEAAEADRANARAMLEDVLAATRHAASGTAPAASAPAAPAAPLGLTALGTCADTLCGEEALFVPPAAHAILFTLGVDAFIPL